MLTAASAAIFVAAAGQLRQLCLVLSPVVLLLVLGYSFAKRFTWLCHLFLGLAIGVAPAGAWIAVRGELAAPAVWLVIPWPPGSALSTFSTRWPTAISIARLEIYSIPARFGVPLRSPFPRSCMSAPSSPCLLRVGQRVLASSTCQAWPWSIAISHLRTRHRPTLGPVAPQRGLLQPQWLRLGGVSRGDPCAGLHRLTGGNARAEADSGPPGYIAGGPRNPFRVHFRIVGHSRNRTYNKRIKSPLLYQLSYAPVSEFGERMYALGVRICQARRARRESNPQPSASKADALSS